MLYIKGQVSERCGMTTEEILEITEEALQVEESNVADGAPPSELLGKLYKLKGAFWRKLGKTEEAKEAFQNAIKVFTDIGSHKAA